MSDDFNKIMIDAIVYGKVFVRDGTAIPLDEVYINQEEKMTEDLVTRLRDFPVRDCCSQRAEAADRIEQLEAALLDANNTLAAAFARIHCLPRTTDTNLATKIGKTRAAIHAALEEKDGG